MQAPWCCGCNACGKVFDGTEHSPTCPACLMAEGMETLVIEKTIAPLAGKPTWLVYKTSQGRQYASIWPRLEWAEESADSIALRHNIRAIVYMDSTRMDEYGVMQRAGMTLAAWR